jgi:hypothetical protein
VGILVTTPEPGLEGRRQPDEPKCRAGTTAQTGFLIKVLDGRTQLNVFNAKKKWAFLLQLTCCLQVVGVRALLVRSQAMPAG